MEWEKCSKEQHRSFFRITPFSGRVNFPFTREKGIIAKGKFWISLLQGKRELLQKGNSEFTFCNNHSEIQIKWSEKSAAKNNITPFFESLLFPVGSPHHFPVFFFEFPFCNDHSCVCEEESMCVWGREYDFSKNPTKTGPFLQSPTMMGLFKRDSFERAQSLLKRDPA